MDVAKPTLICIPDISGFTQFMSDTDIELSARVIPSLLNKVIYANTIGLKVSEIEGDAILFYKTGELPTFETLVNQCRKFYTDFYQQLAVLKKNYEHKTDDIFPDLLGLKIILHYGNEVSAVPIGKNIKLMGEDVIIAHRLLKNKIKIDEYILLSEDLLAQYKEEEIQSNFEWARLLTKDTAYEHIGSVSYRYINLEPLIEN
ncbi:DUF2652 domain-containing protein [Aquimarina sp. ERC-38]|uniref:DUF2652 domain-containing protein n=1 Tax=Aquimarina sp. ERC-38 TaxID=2949996 RepID=UPI002244FE16|nr:DUF2652 domain-containing protein [Aquimarina sp. ERC-38]UZO81111.1 DUF2652 domain-containing protein [Aquimarina sp. ERC-38]